MSSASENIFDYCGQVRAQFKQFSLGQDGWAKDIKTYIEELRESDKWSPQPLLQINPQYLSGCTIAELIEKNELHENWTHLNKLPASLYLHQKEAIAAANRGDNYVITAGTGSGKSLGYLIPIVNSIYTARQKAPDSKGIKAIICYPMNALVNSQIEEMKQYHFQKHGITYAPYTGQDNELQRINVAENPPDILLTNFMMLEYMLTRNKKEEKKLLDAMRQCRFLVMDELHTYRGRQGADIAMLIRRLRLHIGEEFLCVGTSATMTSEAGDDNNSGGLVANFASRLFGSNVKPQNIISETLVRKTNDSENRNSVIPRLHAEIQAGVSSLLSSRNTFINSAIAVWCEFEFGIEAQDTGRLVRKHPQSIQSAAEKLEQDSGKTAEECEKFLCEFLTQAAAKGWFAMRLHQFFSGPGQFLSTLKKDDDRDFSVLGEKHNQNGDTFYTTHFCRNCWHEFHPVWQEGDTFLHRYIDDTGTEHDNQPINFGFITPVTDRMQWQGDDDERISKPPDEWLTEDRGGNIKIRNEKKHFQPQLVFLNRKGKKQRTLAAASPYIFLPGRFRFCPNCGDVHTATGRDINRLASLNTEGRCSATTMLLLSLLEHEPAFRENDKAKALAFSDNRQDAALQAGYFNDFIFTLKLRAGLLKALEDAHGELRHDSIALSVANALGYTEEEVFSNINRRREFLLNPGSTDLTSLQRSRQTLQEIIGYHLIFDLRRGWRHNNPNLEKLDLLKIEFDGADKLHDISEWKNPPPFICEMPAAKRQELAQTVLIHLLEEKCVNSRYLSEETLTAIPNKARDILTLIWYDKTEDNRFESAKMLGVGKQKGRSSYFARSGPTSRLGKKIRPKGEWQEGELGTLSTEQYQDVLQSILDTLTAVNLVIQKDVYRDGSAFYQLNCDCLRWKLNSSTAGNPYYVALYQNIKQMLSDPASRADLAVLEANEHTAQVNTADRQELEKRFRGEDKNTRLPVLVCSPTMELGIDISDLNTVYLRNVPPTPANYVQRSGRAGRAGAAALVLTYCAAQSPHDQYFFARQRDMVAGRIVAPAIELANQDLLVSHFNAIWLRKTGVAFEPQVSEIMNLAADKEKLRIKEKYKIILQNAALKQELRQDIKQLITDMQTAGYIPEHAKHWLNPGYEPPDMYKALEDALDRWRDLYRATHQQMEAMHRIMQDPAAPRRERERAQRLYATAYQQNDQLIKDTQDFYAYRFLASQGFLPGYNFPRLPLVAFLPRSAKTADRISRPRFLALSEFGPRSFIYHQGSRYCVSRAILRVSQNSGTAVPETEQMKICQNCGYGYRDAPTLPDLCHCCQQPLTDADTLPGLYEIQDFIVHRQDRINAGEEERQRQGYDLRSAYYFHESTANRISGKVPLPGNTLLLDYGHAATVLRINLGWRRRATGNGFSINPVTGEWKKSENETSVNGGGNDNDYSVRIIPYVKDSRNILIMRWQDQLSQVTTTTLRHALKLGMTETFQLEEKELSVEPLPGGKDGCNAFLYYEAAEGGAGVLTRLPAEPDLLAKIARAALHRMHFQLPENIKTLKINELKNHQTGGACKSGCYRCLLSYYNQLEQHNINRLDTIALSILLELAGTPVKLSPPQPPAPTPPQPSPPADNWQTAATAAGWKTPDAAAYPLPAGITANYYYAEAKAAVFIGSQPDEQQKIKLEDAGYFLAAFPAEAEKWQPLFDRPAYKRIFS